MEAALKALPAKFRKVVELVDLDGLAYVESAEILRVPLGTAMSRLHRPRARIRADLVAADVRPDRPGR